MGYIGFVMFLIGGAAMDSNQIVAAVLTLAGLALVYVDSKQEERRETRCEK